MESTSTPAASSHPGTLHFIPPNLSAFEPTKPLALSSNVNTLIWIGGLFDTYLSVSYPLAIAQSLNPTWSVVLASLDSAGKGWAASSISRDADDIAKIVAYFKTQRPGGKIVIMGHSTGSQDCMEYIVGKNAAKRPAIDGVILQAPVSDRESLEKSLPEAFMNEANQLALQMCRDGKDKDYLPNRLTRPAFGRVGVTAKRWVDVASPAPNHDGADDYFSSDLSDERLKNTFGKLPPTTPLLILYGGSDESVPDDVDKRRLVQRWMHIAETYGARIDAVNGGIVEGATHNLNGQSGEVVLNLVTRVNGFLTRLDKGEITGGGGSRM